MKLSLKPVLLIIAGLIVLIGAACAGRTLSRKEAHEVTMGVPLRLKPVHLFHKNSFVGNATMETDDQGNPLRVITATHILLGTSSWKTYEYRVVLPNGKYGERGKVSGFQSDVIKMSQPGRFADISISFVSGGRVKGERLVDWHWYEGTMLLPRLESKGERGLMGLRFPQPIVVRNKASGAEAEIVGAFAVPDLGAFYVLIYETRDHESGTGFIDETSGEFYVLNGVIPIDPKSCERLGISSEIQSVSLVTPVRLGNLL